MTAPAMMGALTLYASTSELSSHEPWVVHAKEAVDLKAVRNEITNVIDTDAEKRGDGTSLAGTFIRLAWHCSGTYQASDNSGGSNGKVRTKDLNDRCLFLHFICFDSHAIHLFVRLHFRRSHAVRSRS